MVSGGDKRCGHWRPPAGGQRPPRPAAHRTPAPRRRRPRRCHQALLMLGHEVSKWLLKNEPLIHCACLAEAERSDRGAGAWCGPCPGSSVTRRRRETVPSASSPRARRYMHSWRSLKSPLAQCFILCTHVTRVVTVLSIFVLFCA